ncbi:MAG TPA: TIGR00730 family Rossman fold protein [Gemmatimonadaceae bacterium]
MTVAPSVPSVRVPSPGLVQTPDLDGMAITCFAGGREGVDSTFLAAACETGAWLARCNTQLVYGGGQFGVMGALNRGYRQAGGRKVTGVLLDHFESRGRVDAIGSAVERHSDLGARKTSMIRAADGILVLPGGIGTLDELLSALALVQVNACTAPIVLYDVRGFFRPILGCLEALATDGFCRHDELGVLSCCSDLEHVGAIFAAAWMGRTSATGGDR